MKQANALNAILVNKKRYTSRPDRVALRKNGSFVGMYDIGRVCLDACPEFAKYEQDGAFNLTAYVNDILIEEKVRWSDKSGWGTISATSKTGWTMIVMEEAVE